MRMDAAGTGQKGSKLVSAESDEGERGKTGHIRGLMRNLISLVGITLAAISLANIVFLFLVALLTKRPSPYLGILTYMVFPALLILGLLLIPIGMWRERRRRRTALPGEIPRLPRIDLNNTEQRRALEIFGVCAVLFVMLSAVGSYRAYQFTDSVTFCGRLCHTVMKPEYTAYLQSPHARVACVECHVGPGASWYVRSKLSGSYQVYSAIFHKYPRPIPTPVANLRPAQQTCEQCHWPKKFYGAQLKVFYHYAPDEKNTPRQIRMLINTGGAEPLNGLPSGIHWHMNIANQITFIATDPQRQVIPWVEAKNLQGKVTVYKAKDSTLTAAQIAATPKHRMDCIDCHDRPSHMFKPPDESVDESLLAGRIDTSLPYIKRQAVAELTKHYDTTEQAMEGIGNGLRNFYSSQYPEVYKDQRAAVNAAITDVQQIYRSTIFPYMRVDWRTHPNNIGHLYTPGCFRCHDGQHVSADGKVIPKKCDTCHTVLAEVTSGSPLIGHEHGIAFQHPIDLGDLTQVTCSDCHTGGVGP
jgi:nitrate/TMAO reductase-like tetraheme cytochrome c subunit